MTNQLKESLLTLARSLPTAWLQILQPHFESAAFQQLAATIEQKRLAGTIIYPKDPFFALRMIEPRHVRVVILGQDPYHGPGQAQGMAFSVPNDCKRPPSLRNILQEVARTEGGDPTRMANNLTPWLMQGVLLLNTVLTVEDGQAAAHAKMGWEAITDAIVQALADLQPMAFMLWGAHAQAKRALIGPKHAHELFCSNHPSPLSANKPPVPFMGCGHFQKCNQWLVSQGQSAIVWQT